AERDTHVRPAGGVGGGHPAHAVVIAPAYHAPYHPQPLRRDAELIAHRHADPRLAHVEGRDPHASRLTPAPRGRKRRARPAGPGPLRPLTSQSDFCRVADILVMALLFDRVQKPVTLPRGGSPLTVSLSTPA